MLTSSNLQNAWACMQLSSLSRINMLCVSQVGGTGGAAMIAQYLADKKVELECIVDEVCVWLLLCMVSLCFWLEQCEC